MALFKISKGLAANLPNTYNEGYCYFTTDDGKFYIDTSNDASGRVALNAYLSDRARQLTYEATDNGEETPYFRGGPYTPVYFNDGVPVVCDTSFEDKADKVHGIYYGTCPTAASTATKVVTLTNANGFELVPGAVIAVKFTYSNTASTPKLNVQSTGAIGIMQYGTQKVSSSSTTNGWASGAIQVFIYDGTNWVRDYWSNTTYTVPGAISTTAASTSAKTASATNYKLRANSHFEITLSNSNTAQSALTLNIESTGAKSIYINKKASSASNYTLPAGKYIVFYDGNYYHFTTDGTIPGLPEDKNTTYTLTQNGTDITLEGNDGSSQTVSDSHVTSVDNHYTPTTNTNSALTANANSTTSASWGSTDIVTGVTLNRDAAGHVTGISVSSK